MPLNADRPATAGFDAATQMAVIDENLYGAIPSDPRYQEGGESRLANLVEKTYDRDGDFELLSPSDRLALSWINRSMIKRIEAEYYLYEHGFLERSHWIARRNWLAGYLELPVNAAWWAVEQGQGIYPPAFISAIVDGERTAVTQPDGRF